jgi:hypothetical protein
LRLIERTLDSSEQVSREVDVSWLKLVDEVKEQQNNKPHLSLADFQLLAQKHQIDPNCLPELLLFFNQMGVLTWFQDFSLRDIVILDPVETFVKPVTRLICQLLTTEDSTRMQILALHEECRRVYSEDWERYLSSGILSESIVQFLLNGCNIPLILNLMKKFSLLIELPRIQSEDEDGRRIPLLYLVPAFLPEHNQALEMEINLLNNNHEITLTVVYSLRITAVV